MQKTKTNYVNTDELYGLYLENGTANGSGTTNCRAIRIGGAAHAFSLSFPHDLNISHYKFWLPLYLCVHVTAAFWVLMRK